MNKWLDIGVVAIVVLASAGYALYLLGPRSIKNIYTRFATKHFGLRAAKWFAPKANDSCGSCSSRDEHRPWLASEANRKYKE